MTTRTRNLIIGGVLGAIALAVFGVVQWNAYQTSITVIDSCGNTPASLAKAVPFEACATVSGRVGGVTALPNGDIQVQLQLSRDSSYARNLANQGLQNGNLLVLLPCGTATDLPSQYFQTCSAFKNTAIKPGYHNPLTYTGNLVINQRFGWIEMLPSNEAPGA